MLGSTFIDIVIHKYLRSSVYCRFMKHTSKPRDKSVTPVRSTEAKDNETDDANTEGTPKPRGVIAVVPDDKLKAATPGNYAECPVE